MNENKAIDHVEKLLEIYENTFKDIEKKYPNDERRIAIFRAEVDTIRVVLRDLKYREENEWFA